MRKGIRMVTLLGFLTSSVAPEAARATPQPSPQGQSNAVATLTYAQVWAGAPPEHYLSRGHEMLADGQALVVFVPRFQVEANIDRHQSGNGWLRSAYARPDLTPCIIVISDDVPASAIQNVREHEAAHCAGWGFDHLGALKPAGHIERCLATGLPRSELIGLCLIDQGASLRAGDAERWAALTDTIIEPSIR